uniref:C-type lectin domain-containing protein n=1 Tax=Seriola lalandi dorsalis TaxID=1841481 RepID=A0A3B4WTK4_SERLL
HSSCRKMLPTRLLGAISSICWLTQKLLSFLIKNNGLKMIRPMLHILFRLSAGSARILKEYVYVNMPKTWVEAQSYCREMFNDLATVTNRDFNNKLMSVIQGHGRFVWIGLHDERTKWEWSLNNRPNNWKLRKQCTVITKNGYWLDISCMERLPAKQQLDKTQGV